MVQPQKKQKQPPDAYSQRGKTLASSAQRLRGWVGSDPARLPELADALVELTAHRLLGHAFGGAAPDAQDAVRYAAQLLTANGPIGPYTSATDAARVVTAVVHMAAIQAAAGLPAAAGSTVESLAEMQQQLSALGVEEQLMPQTAIWALSSSARAALHAGEISTANAYADAARDRLLESGLRHDADAAHLVLDVDRLVSDARWAAGRASESVTGLHAAMDRYTAVVAGRLDEPGRLSPALLERLSGPIFGLHRDMADRLAATGEADLGLVTRRELVQTLERLTKRLGDPARNQLRSAWSDLAIDLLAVDRADEAEAASAQAAALLLTSPQTGSGVVPAAVRAQTLTRLGRSAEAVALLRQVLPGELDGAPTAGQAFGLIALAEALLADGDLSAAESTERAFADAARELLGSEADADSARSRIQDLARGAVSRGRGSVTWEPLPPSVSYAATTASAAGSGHADDGRAGTDAEKETAAWLVAERTEAHHREQERLQQARLDIERRDEERMEAERSAAVHREAARAEAERGEQVEAQRRVAAEEAERLAVKARREERLEAHRLEAARQEHERRRQELLEAERAAAVRLAADPEATEGVELERLQAELAELERREVEGPFEQAEPAADAAEHPAVEPDGPVDLEPNDDVAVEPKPLEAVLTHPEPVVVEAAEPVEVEPAEPVEVEPAVPVVVEPVEPEHDEHPEPDLELDHALQEWRDARARGDRRGTRATNERVVELLRPRSEADLAQYGPQLLTALEELSSARLRGGDLWGSRAPAREAKALAKTLGR